MARRHGARGSRDAKCHCGQAPQFGAAPWRRERSALNVGQVRIAVAVDAAPNTGHGVVVCADRFLPLPLAVRRGCCDRRTHPPPLETMAMAPKRFRAKRPVRADGNHSLPASGLSNSSSLSRESHLPRTISHRLFQHLQALQRIAGDE